MTHKRLEPHRPANAGPDDKFIYESPDGGKTVYARPLGSDLSKRMKVFEDPEHLKEKAFYERWHKFRDILQASENSATLRNLLEQAETIYELVKDD